MVVIRYNWLLFKFKYKVLNFSDKLLVYNNHVWLVAITLEGIKVEYAHCTTIQQHNVFQDF